MAVVLTSEESSYFAPAALRRSHSQPKFVSRQPSAIHNSSSASRIQDHYSQPVKIFADSAPSTAPSSPRTLQPSAADLSCSSTPASNLSFSTDSESNGESLLQDLDDENDIFFPAYNGYLDTSTPEELEPPPSPRAGSSPGNGTSTGSTSNSRTPEVYEPGAVDDTAVGIQPTRHVDYLSHDWKEEDIWSSWKHIVSNREEFGNSARLENASWRTWIKAKNHLKTISPETLNWLKDCDVTWLYGPLLPGKKTFTSASSVPDAQTTSSAGLSKSNSFIESQSKKKPILKKRSMSEVMLQKSLSSSSLIKQAAAAVQAQQKAMPKGIRVIARPKFERAATDYATFPFSSRRLSREQLSVGPSSSTSGVISPSSERKHIHFNEQVEQCIAVDVKGDDDDDDLESDRFNFDSDSDDGIMMMKTTTRKRRPILKRRTSSQDKKKKSINLLPPTTLKYREDTPEPTETAMKHSYRSPVMSPSSSQETLRPSKTSAKKMFFVDDDDDEDDEVDNDGESDDGLRSPPPGGFSSSGLHRTSSASNLKAAPSGMRRTESGMFMPYEEGESASEGIFGFVLDTVNTARDIAHVVWNVGWRR
ncbi:protein phosphatase regulator [Cytospora paraplurivora]|uniref:Protein phosphatase regulator n=1 Tax=Cytospora paraplurivora TaxID=2898453 RepID=A0AAN9UAE9_9PEZI